MTDLCQIKEIAALIHLVDQEVVTGPPADAELVRRLAALTATDRRLVIFAGKMMEGKPCRIVTDNRNSITAHRAMAQHLGAHERESRQDGPMTSILFVPTAPQ